MNVAVIFLGLFGLFGLFFNGAFVIGLIAASISAVAAGVLAFINVENFKNKKWFISVAVLISVVGCAYDAYSYYAFPQWPGNYYGVWGWSIPLNVLLLIILKKTWGQSVKNTKP